jgi:hypothetical protein
MWGLGNMCLIAALIFHGWGGHAILCLHDDGSKHVINAPSALAEAPCHEHHCDQENQSSEIESCGESAECVDVLLAKNELPLANSAGLRGAVPPSKVVEHHVWEELVTIPNQATVAAPLLPRAPPQRLACIHLAIASTVLRI